MTELKTVEQFLDELNRSHICNFQLKILTQLDPNKEESLHELFVVTRYGRQPEPIEFGDFVNYLCDDEQDLRVLRFLLSKHILEEQMHGTTKSTISLNLII